MRELIDANNFLTHLVWSGLIDEVTCGELAKAVELCKVEAIPKAEYEELFINKPCVSSEVCKHDKNKVLDKIRAEIIENSIEDYKYHGCGTDELIIETSEVLKIIDKYKEESDETN